MSWLCCHEPVIESRRDHKGRATGVIDWRCLKCLRVIGTTSLQPKFKLLRFLRTQAVEAKRKIA